MQYFAKSNWKKFGLQKSIMNPNGFFFFKFDSEKGMMDVLEGGAVDDTQQTNLP